MIFTIEEKDMSRYLFFRNITNFYNESGQLEATQDPSGYVTEYAYDEAGQIKEKMSYITPASNGNALEEIRPPASEYDVRTYYFYDACGRCVKEVSSTDANSASKLTLSEEVPERSSYFYEPNG